MQAASLSSRVAQKQTLTPSIVIRGSGLPRARPVASFDASVRTDRLNRIKMLSGGDGVSVPETHTSELYVLKRRYSHLPLAVEFIDAFMDIEQNPGKDAATRHRARMASLNKSVGELRNTRADLIRAVHITYGRKLQDLDSHYVPQIQSYEIHGVDPGEVKSTWVGRRQELQMAYDKHLKAAQDWCIDVELAYAAIIRAGLVLSRRL